MPEEDETKEPSLADAWADTLSARSSPASLSSKIHDSDAEPETPSTQLADAWTKTLPPPPPKNETGVKLTLGDATRVGARRTGRPDRGAAELEAVGEQQQPAVELKLRELPSEVDGGANAVPIAGGEDKLVEFGDVGGGGAQASPRVHREQRSDSRRPRLSRNCRSALAAKI